MGVVVLVVWEIGQAVWVYRALEEAAREGARYAIVHGSSSKRSYTPQAIEKEVLAALPGWEPGELEVTVRGGRSPGSVVEVEVTHRLDLGVTCWMFARDHWKLTARARMRVFR